MSHLASPAQPRGTWAKPGTDENDDSDLDERPRGRAPGTGVEETRFLYWKRKDGTGKKSDYIKGTVCLEKLLTVDLYVSLYLLVASLFQEHSFWHWFLLHKWDFNLLKMEVGLEMFPDSGGQR